jgi:hypothetical protein
MISSLILVVNHVKEKEDHFVHIYVHRFVIVVNVNHVNFKVHWLNVIVKKLKDWQNVVNRELYFNVVKNVKRCLNVVNIDVKEIVIMMNVMYVKKNI